MKCITYTRGYKYQLEDAYSIAINIKPDVLIKTDYIQLDTEGILTISNGYAWDGPSGPTIDTLSFMRGALVHDALYQLMRYSKLDRDIYRDDADRILKDICKNDGMWSWRAWLVYQGVRIFGDPSSDPKKKKKIIRAPKGCQP